MAPSYQNPTVGLVERLMEGHFPWTDVAQVLLYYTGERPACSLSTVRGRWGIVETLGALLPGDFVHVNRLNGTVFYRSDECENWAYDAACNGHHYNLPDFEEVVGFALGYPEPAVGYYIDTRYHPTPAAVPMYREAARRLASGEISVEEWRALELVPWVDAPDRIEVAIETAMDFARALERMGWFVGGRTNISTTQHRATAEIARNP